jgi:branched-chain amino acid transport system permease protein
MMKIIVGSPFGYTLRALRDNAERAAFIGINVRRRRWSIFVIAGAFAGLAGGLMALFVSGAYPDFAGFSKDLEPLVVILVGGMYNFFGPLLGATIIVILESYIVKFTPYWPLIIGVLLVLLCIFARGGIMDYLSPIRLRSIRDLLGRRFKCVRRIGSS